MFEGIEPPAAWSPSPRLAIAYFGLMFVACVIAGSFAWFRWSSPLSTTRIIYSAEFILGGVLSGVFFLRARKASPTANRRCFFLLIMVMLVPHFFVDVFMK